MVLPKAKQTCIFYQDIAYNLLCYKNISIQKSCLNSLSPVFKFYDLLSILSSVFNPPIFFTKTPLWKTNDLHFIKSSECYYDILQLLSIISNYKFGSNFNFFLSLPGKHPICWCSELSSIPVSLGANSTRLSYRTLAHYICLSPGQQLLTLAALLI